MRCPNCGTDNGSYGVECYQCGTSLQATPTAAIPDAGGVFLLDKYLLNQKMLSLTDKYYVTDEAGNKLIYVEREMLYYSIKINFYTDETMRTLLMSLERADPGFWTLGLRLTLKLPTGQILAYFNRDFLTSAFIRRTWDISDPDGRSFAKAEEDSMFFALLNRVLSSGSTNFSISVDGRQAGTFIRKFTIADKYVLDLSADPQKTLDRRVAVALAVLLDTAEAR